MKQKELSKYVIEKTKKINDFLSISLAIHPNYDEKIILIDHFQSKELIAIKQSSFEKMLKGFNRLAYNFE